MYNISITTYMSIKPFKKLILLKLLTNTFCVYCDFLNKNLYNNCMNMHSFLNTFYLRYKVIKGSDVFVYQKYIKHCMCHVLLQWMQAGSTVHVCINSTYRRKLGEEQIVHTDMLYVLVSWTYIQENRVKYDHTLWSDVSYAPIQGSNLQNLWCLVDSYLCYRQAWL